MSFPNGKVRARVTAKCWELHKFPDHAIWLTRRTSFILNYVGVLKICTACPRHQVRLQCSATHTHPKHQCLLTMNQDLHIGQRLTDRPRSAFGYREQGKGKKKTKTASEKLHASISPKSNRMSYFQILSTSSTLNDLAHIIHTTFPKRPGITNLA